MLTWGSFLEEVPHRALTLRLAVGLGQGDIKLDNSEVILLDKS